MSERRILIFIGVLLVGILLHAFNPDLIKSPANGLGTAAGIAGLGF